MITIYWNKNSTISTYCSKSENDFFYTTTTTTTINSLSDINQFFKTLNGKKEKLKLLKSYKKIRFEKQNYKDQIINKQFNKVLFINYRIK